MADLSSLLSPIRQDIVDIQGGPIKTWAPTDILLMNQCPLALYKKKALRHYGGQSATASRGDDIHECIKDFIEGDSSRMPAIKGHVEYIEKLQERYFDHPDHLHMEERWAFDTNWTPCDWSSPQRWAKMKLDLCLFDPSKPTVAEVDDWKSGKKYGNEAKHRLQGQAYAIGTFMKFPSVEYVEVTFRYVDIARENTLKSSYTRESIAPLIVSWTNKGIAITGSTDFQPRPAPSNCEYCPFAPWNPDCPPEQRCMHGVQR